MARRSASARSATCWPGPIALVLLRGQWVEIDRDRLKATMERFAAAEALARRDGLTFAQALRLLAGAAVTEEDDPVDTAQWGQGKRRTLAG